MWPLVPSISNSPRLARPCTIVFDPRGGPRQGMQDAGYMGRPGADLEVKIVLPVSFPNSSLRPNFCRAGVCLRHHRRRLPVER